MTINEAIDLYKLIPLQRRRLLVALAVPTSEYIVLEPVRLLLIKIGTLSPVLGVAFIPVLLIFCLATAIAIVVFVIEAAGISIKNQVVGLLFGIAVLAWVFVPLHVITHLK